MKWKENVAVSIAKLEKQKENYNYLTEKDNEQIGNIGDVEKLEYEWKTTFKSNGEEQERRGRKEKVGEPPEEHTFKELITALEVEETEAEPSIDIENAKTFKVQISWTLFLLLEFSFDSVNHYVQLMR